MLCVVSSLFLVKKAHKSHAKHRTNTKKYARFLLLSLQMTIQMTSGSDHKKTKQWLPWFTCKNEGFHDLLVYLISRLSIPWTSMVCATRNSFTRQVTPVSWIYMAHILLCLSIFPKSNHSSPYDDDVVPGIPRHFPVLGICCVCFCLCLYAVV